MTKRQIRFGVRLGLALCLSGASMVHAQAAKPRKPAHPVVPAPAPQPTFEIKPDQIQPGGTAVLSWNTKGSKPLSIVAEPFEPMLPPVPPAKGIVTVHPTATSTYTLTPSGLGGVPLVLKLVVQKKEDDKVSTNSASSAAREPEFTVSLAATPSDPKAAGQKSSTVKICWIAPGADSVSLDATNVINEPDHCVDKPSETTAKHVLVATQKGKIVTASLTVNATPAPSEGILFSPLYCFLIVLISIIALVILLFTYMKVKALRGSESSQKMLGITTLLNEHKVSLAKKETALRNLATALKKDRDAAATASNQTTKAEEQAAAEEQASLLAAKNRTRAQVVQTQAEPNQEPTYPQEPTTTAKANPYASFSMEDTRARVPEKDPSEFSGELVPDYNLARSMGPEGEFAFLRNYPVFARLRCDNYDEVRSRPDLLPRFTEDDNGMFLLVEQNGKGLVVPYLDRDFSLTRKSLEGIFTYPEHAGGDLRLVRPAMLDRTSSGWSWIKAGACGYRG